MSVQNFDPEWAKHLKHDPDTPLAVNVPVPGGTWSDYSFGCQQIRASVSTKPVPVDESRKAPNSGEASTTWINVKLKLSGSREEMVVPCQTSTSTLELSEVIAAKVGVTVDELSFVYKQGPHIRKKHPHEEVSREMLVRGIKSFTRMPEKYDHPRAIIGAGHIGLRMALFYVKRQQFDFVVFDRMHRVGGTSWMYQANSTSKLQTEFGAYHLDYGEEFSLPTDFTTPWPSRNALLDHFERVASEQGILPYVRLNTNVKHMDTIGPKGDIKHYELVTEKMEAGMLKYGKIEGSNIAGEELKIDVCSIAMFPGNLTLPRMVEYPGEEDFDGDIGYGMFNEIDYHKLAGQDVTILGHGAFAVENIRTCCEFGVRKIHLVCRRANLSCPRVVSWMANRSMNPLINARFMKSMQPMYDMIGRDPWSYYSVQANAAHTTCSIVQKARFGIGDVYFLSIYMGKVELIIDKGVKRLSRHTVHLDSGRKITCNALLKLLGLVGEMENDRLLKVQEMVGFWVNGDPRRYLVAEPVSVMCTSMGGTSMSPGAYAWGLDGIYMVDYPKDFINGPLASGLLPKHSTDLSDEGTPRPAYVVDARHGTQTAMTLGMSMPNLQLQYATAGYIKAVRHRLCHPVKKFLAQAKEDWDYYAKKMLDEGFGTDKPYPDYPYTPEVVMEMYKEHQNESGEQPMPCDAADLALCGL